MMKTQKKTANVIGGKTARACQSCLKRRASWFCAADDAFLCDACDSSVHSANELAGRHSRVCLETSKPPPSWHRGFTKKARTPRKHSLRYNNQMMMMPVVPQVGNDDDDEYEDQMVEEDKNNRKSTISDDQMVFSVPNLDDDDHRHPFENNNIIGLSNTANYCNGDDELIDFSMIGFEGDGDDHGHEWEFPAEEMAEFAADVESLLEQEEEEEGGAKGDDDLHLHLHQNECLKGVVKHEQEGEMISSLTNDHCFFDWSIDVESELFNFDLNNNYGDFCGGNDEHIHHSHRVSGAEEGQEENSRNNNNNNNNNNNIMVPKDEVEESYNNGNNVDDDDGMQANKRRKILLRLNYEEVINAWASRGCSSPWTTGRRPEFDLDHHGWPYCMGELCPTGVDRRGNVNGGDGGREARVSRYREKRRTRLFSKKIRYEVRKLNAEKRPRLKGRFVKRTTLSQVVGVRGG